MNINIKKSILAIVFFSSSVLFSNFAYATEKQDPLALKPVPYRVDYSYYDSQYILINQSGDLVSPPNVAYQKINYFPLNGIWRATRQVKVAWETKPITVDTFFDDLGQVVKMDSSDLIYQDLGEKRLLKFSAKEDRYLLADHKGKVIKKLDPRIIEISPYSSKLALAKIKIVLNEYRSEYRYRYGYLNLKGEWAIQPQYSAAEEFNGKYAAVTKGSTNLTIDPQGKTIAKLANEDHRTSLSNGYWMIWVAKNKGKWFTGYVINAQNKVLISDVSATLINKNLFALTSTLKGNEGKGILNTETGEIIPYDGMISFWGNYQERQKHKDKFWVRINLDDKWVYRQLDNNLNTLLEGDYRFIDEKFWGYGWIRTKDNNGYVLIDSTGKQVSKIYKSINMYRYGDDIYTLAEDGDRKEYLSPSGQLIAYKKNIGKDKGCARRFDVLFTTDDTPLWPTDINARCLLSKNYDEMEEEKQAEYIQAYIEYKRENIDTGHYRKEIIPVHGPAVININDVATFTLPKDYVYMQTPNEGFECHGYILSKDFDKDKWQICVAAKDIGHVNQLALNHFGQDSDKLQTAIIDFFKHFKEKNERYHFTWLKEPTFNSQEKTLSWGYELINQYEGIVELADFYSNAALLKLGKSHVIALLTKKDAEAKSISAILDEWGSRITFNPTEEYQEGEKFTCNQLPAGDKSLLNISAYLPREERCFSYPLAIFLTGEDESFNAARSEVLRFIRNGARISDTHMKINDDIRMR